MWTDPIVEEVRREREAHAERFEFDVVAICRELQQLQEQESDRTLILPPEAPQQQCSPAALALSLGSWLARLWCD